MRVPRSNDATASIARIYPTPEQLLLSRSASAALFRRDVGMETNKHELLSIFLVCFLLFFRNAEIKSRHLPIVCANQSRMHVYIEKRCHRLISDRNQMGACAICTGIVYVTEL